MTAPLVEVVAAEVDVLHHLLEYPLVLSSGVVTTLPEVTVRLTVSDGRSTAEGFGAVNLSDAWAWPGDEPTSAAKQQEMIDYCRLIGDSILARTAGRAHPLELGTRVHDSVLADVEHPAPTLARTVCGSAFDAAIHDATGRLAGVSAFALYEQDVEIPSLDGHFEDGAVAAIREVLRPPASRVPGWWLVAPGDDLDRTAGQVERTGMTRFKLKLSGADPAADARRVADIITAASTWVAEPVLSIDPNEGSASSRTVLEFLDALGSHVEDALSYLVYLEQPTSRTRLAVDDWSEVSRRVPVLVDEALTSMDDLHTARERGWSGVAVKTCKGHSLALAAAAWAVRHQMSVSVQDLTNIGRSAIHSYLLAAHLPTINGVEINSPQYLPRSNDPWLPRLAGLFDPRDGFHRLDLTGLVGLGAQL